MTFLAPPFSLAPTRLGRAGVFSSREIARGGTAQQDRRAVAGFSLVELLVVLAIISILASIMLLSISGTKSSRDLGRAAYEIQGVLEQARTSAMAGNTYVWVGFFEEDPLAAATTPQAAGNGQLVIAVVSSQDGTNLSSQVTASQKLPPAALTALTKLLKIPNVHLDANLTAAATATRPAATYEVNPTVQSGSATFDFPISTGGGAPAYHFQQILQFNPQGDASVIYGNPTQYIEIGLRPSHGNIVAATNPDVAAIQITGIGGQVMTYRP